MIKDVSDASTFTQLARAGGLVDGISSTKSRLQEHSRPSTRVCDACQRSVSLSELCQEYPELPKGAMPSSGITNLDGAASLPTPFSSMGRILPAQLLTSRGAAGQR